MHALCIPPILLNLSVILAETEETGEGPSIDSRILESAGYDANSKLQRKDSVYVYSDTSGLRHNCYSSYYRV